MNIDLKLPEHPTGLRDISDAERYLAELCRYLEGMCVTLNRALMSIDDANVAEISVSKISGITTESVPGLIEYIGEKMAELIEYVDNKIEGVMMSGS
ncbi:MAG: hypothetical protein J1G06_06465 [Oscillospiraceae bacterium]|nr:hypothetical protein [Oscillospiraceae bacterium]